MENSSGIWRIGWLCLLLTLNVLPSPGDAQQEDAIFEGGFETGDTSEWSVTVGQAPKVLRFTDLDLRDPHVFIDFVGCFDVTDEPVLGFSFNESLEEQINGDADGDEFLDLTSLLLFRPLNPIGIGERVDFDDGLCLTPVEDPPCGPDPATSPQVLSYDGITSGVCLEAIPGTTSGYVPTIDEPLAHCFVTAAEEVMFQLGDLTVTLQDLQIAASFLGTPVPTQLESGLIRGFISEADADALLLPDELPIVGGQPLSLLLPGGTNNCAEGDDRDLHNGVLGWWFYFNYTAERVTYFTPCD